jgi:DNA-binding winged helix-turn-helix (wHTH) protein/TolB-like protein/tetratricopeptide (TPR) repeat protein
MKTMVYSFGRFQLDRRERRLLNDGAPVPLQPKVFDTLVLLVERHGELIGKAEMMEALWPGTFVGESALTKNISDLRKALADGADGTGFIETVPKTGYRFVRPVEIVQEAGIAPPAPAAFRAARWSPWLLAPVAIVLAAVATWLVVVRPPATRAAGVRSIAVLPFRPMSAQQRDEFLEFGMADALISRLNGAGTLIVRPIDAVRQVPSGGSDAVEAGRKLRVDGVVEGSVQKLNDALRVTARLIRVRDGEVLWAGSIDDTFGNLFKVQDSLARQVMEAMAIRLTPERQKLVTRRDTTDPDAYLSYQKGRFFASRRTAEGFEKAIASYQKAIDKDPGYALAWSGLSDAHMLTAWYYARPEKTAHALAREAALRAIALDDSLAEAHTSMAVVYENADWAFSNAQREFQRALGLNPNYATAHHWYGEFLGFMGRTPDALMHLRRAQELDPLSPIIGADTAKVLIDAHRYDEAIEECRRTLELDPTFSPAHGWLEVAYIWKGMYPQAQAEDDLRDIKRNAPDFSLQKALLYTLSGQRAKASEFRRQFQELVRGGPAPPWQMALLYIQVQPDSDKAIEWLRKAYDQRNAWMMSAKVAPDFDPIRSDPRFQDLIRSMNFLD